MAKATTNTGPSSNDITINTPWSTQCNSHLSAGAEKSIAFSKNISKVLVVEDDPGVCNLIKTAIVRIGYIAKTAKTLTVAERIMQGTQFDAILIDIYLGQDQGIDVLKIAAKLQPETPVIMMTGDPSIDTAIDAIRLGAYDYLRKPIRPEPLTRGVKGAIELKKLRNEKRLLWIESQEYRNKLLALIKEKTTALEQSEKRYRTLFEYSRDPMYVTDGIGKFLYLNPAAINLLKYSKEELMSMNLESLFDRPSEQSQFQQVLRDSDTVMEFSAKIRKKNGTLIEGLLTARIIRDSQGQIVESAGIISDITPNKRAADKIRKQDKFLKYVLDTLPYPFIVVGSENYKVEMANAAAEKKGGSASKTCFGKTHGLAVPCSQVGNPCVLEEVIKTRQPVTLEHVHQDGEDRPRRFELSGFPIFNREGKLVQMIEYARDITEQKRLESIAEATNLIKNIGYIFAGIRHEIGNPINSIKMTLDVLKNNFKDYPPETIEEFLTGALSEVSRVEYLLKALRNYSLFENPEIEPVNITDFINDFLPMIYEDLEGKGINVITKIDPDTGFGNVDPRALHQVLLNLLSNATDALTNTRNPKIIISLSKHSKTLYLAIEDNGSGISPEEGKNLFKPFYTSKASGTGLGLAIVKRMLVKMNCSIHVESQIGAGTKMTIAIAETEDEKPKT